MSDNSQEKEKMGNQSGDPGRTPGAAEGDRETVEADLEEKNLDDSQNYEKTKEKKIAESTSRSNQ